jgi:hypothetical protein
MVAAAAAQREQRPDPDREVLVDLARCYSQLAARLPADAAPRRQYLDRALDLLRRAVANGYKDTVVLETDPDLDAVHGEAGFRTMLSGAAGRKPEK